MGFWKMLGIEPTDNVSLIKKAYAKQLKFYHPEDDPEGYQRLREAYDQAISSTKQTAESEPLHPIRDTVTAMVNSDSYIDHTSPSWDNEIFEPADTPFQEHPVQAFMSDVENLYNDFFARITLSNWAELLNADITWSIQYSEILRAQFIEFLQYHYYLPHPVWQIIDNILRINEQKDEFELEYGEEEIQFLLQRINNPKEMSYDIFEKSDALDFDEYLYLREEAQEALIENDLESVEELLEAAFKLHQKDPDLLHMQGIYYLRLKEKEKAFGSFNQLLSISPDHLDGLMYRAKIHHQKGQFIDAIQDCEHLLSIQPEHMDALYLKSNCLIEQGEFEKAKDNIRHALEIDINRPEFFPNNSYLYTITVNEKRKILHNKIYFYAIALMYMRRTWVYFIYFIIALLTPLPFKYAVYLLLPLAWEAWKFSRVRL